jgi:hypothetical protein
MATGHNQPGMKHHDDEVQVELKNDTLQVESVLKSEDFALKSSLDDLTLLATVKRFWKVRRSRRPEASTPPVHTATNQSTHLLTEPVHYF